MSVRHLLFLVVSVTHEKRVFMQLLNMLIFGLNGELNTSHVLSVIQSWFMPPGTGSASRGSTSTGHSDAPTSVMLKSSPTSNDVPPPVRTPQSGHSCWWSQFIWAVKESWTRVQIPPHVHNKLSVNFRTSVLSTDNDWGSIYVNTEEDSCSVCFNLLTTFAAWSLMWSELIAAVTAGQKWLVPFSFSSFLHSCPTPPPSPPQDVDMPMDIHIPVGWLHYYLHLWPLWGCKCHIDYYLINLIAKHESIHIFCLFWCPPTPDWRVWFPCWMLLYFTPNTNCVCQLSRWCPVSLWLKTRKQCW